MASKVDRAGASFALLAYERYGRVVRNYLVHRVRNREDARELAQEVWTRLLRVTEPQKVLDPCRYIYRVAAHVVAEFQELRARNPVLVDSDAFDQSLEFAAAPEPAERLNAQRDILRALEDLSPAFREIILLRIREGMSYDEIGARLGFSAGTARRYFFTAMALARSAWAGTAR
jgi:RNA polymerase sigma-70 factor (ECF subfamily)